MKISVLCSDKNHPVNSYLEKWVEQKRSLHQIELVRRKKDLSGGDILFLISCAEIVDATDRAAYQSTLVLHASDLPRGRGWSPHIWNIIEGAEEVTLSLLEANDKVDTGRIWKKMSFPVPKHALWHEINASLFEAEIQLMNYAVDEFHTVEPVEQDLSVKSNYYRLRTPADSEIDPHKSLASQFDVVRVCDPNRFPAFFELHGKKYKLILEKYDD
ncbi:MAG: formyltransferase family protein [Vogesella sp.]|uniref:formyltransferase family protein n=1 Tax=Vogesella sp. TaxID=1904252 RepID=UPI00391A17D2